MEGNLLEAEHANDLIRAVTDEEIKSALFSIGEDKAPGPDGFTSCFFKTSLAVIFVEQLWDSLLRVSF